MNLNVSEINTIDDVILVLDRIILESEINDDPLGYFAVLYLRVTQKVKEEIEAGNFDDCARMEQLDVIFAKKYIVAYYDWRNNQRVSQSWEKAFSFSKFYWPVILQHLLMGMNAHINLDLALAAVEVSQGKNILLLQNDFYKINEILASLVDEVQNNLSVIWPALRKILAKTGKLDNLLVDFSMELARDGAWKFAKYLAPFSLAEQSAKIAIRDEKVVKKTRLITNPGTGIKLLLFGIRLGELGSVADKITKLKARTEKTVSLPLRN